LVDKISSEREAVRRLVDRFEDPRSLVACYEAGPTGYELGRQPADLEVRCHVIAPSLIPVAPGNRVKTDKRDARRLALLPRGGQLSGVRVPSVAEEAVRDLCRARADMVIDRSRVRHRLGKFLLRHGRVWRDGESWTLKHRAWIAAPRFWEPALDRTLSHYQATLIARECHRRRARHLVRPGALRRRRAPAGRVPGLHRARRPDARHRGLRLATIPGGSDVQRLLRPGPLGGLDR
jgi:transposase